jgi:hypothetical protein
VAIGKELAALHALNQLGQGVAGLAALSPTLIADTEALLAAGKRISFGAGQGTFTGSKMTGPLSASTKRPGNIVLDPAMKGNASQIVQSLSHEFGHFMYHGTYNFTTAAAFNRSVLKDEAAAES